MAQSRKGRAPRGSAESAKRQIQLGKKLAREKRKCVAAGSVWKSYVKDKFGLSRERADELIRIGAGRTSVEAYRLTKRDKQRARRLATRDRNPAKEKFCQLLSASNAEIASAKERAIKGAFPEHDVAEMRDAVSTTILACQELFDILRTAIQARQASSKAGDLSPDLGVRRGGHVYRTGQIGKPEVAAISQGDTISAETLDQGYSGPVDLVAPSSRLKGLVMLHTPDRANHFALEEAQQAEGLTKAQIKVVELVAAGLANNEIAQRLAVLEATVKSHITQVTKRLDFTNRVQLTVWYVRMARAFDQSRI